MENNQKTKILLIEDEKDVRESYEDMLSLLGYETGMAENGKEGLEELKKDKYDIVLTDLNMPVMNGLETLRRIKKKNADIEVIVITGFATIENAIGAMKQGAFDYITKPVSIDHVKIVLSKCIQQINARRENKKLRDLNTQLSELNDLKNKFITITNHELRTPLAVLKGYVDLLDMEVDRKEGSEQDEYLGIITNTITEMIDMVEYMHDLSGFEKLGETDNKSNFDINDLVQSVYKEVKVLFDNRKINLSLNLEEKPIKVYAEKRILKKAISELVQNALKFTNENGSVSLIIKNIELKNKVFIKVEDTGIGIPHDKIELIFEPFYEVQDVMHHFSSKTDFMGGGIGVGLSLVKEAVESNDGEIAVESTPGQGSVFTIILPVANNEDKTN
jgi:signal transduction histidine kinase